MVLAARTFLVAKIASSGESGLLGLLMLPYKDMTLGESLSGLRVRELLA